MFHFLSKGVSECQHIYEKHTQRDKKIIYTKNIFKEKELYQNTNCVEHFLNARYIF